VRAVAFLLLPLLLCVCVCLCSASFAYKTLFVELLESSSAPLHTHATPHRTLSPTSPPNPAFAAPSHTPHSPPLPLPLSLRTLWVCACAWVCACVGVFVCVCARACCVCVQRVRRRCWSKSCVGCSCSTPCRQTNDKKKLKGTLGSRQQDLHQVKQVEHDLPYASDSIRSSRSSMISPMPSDASNPCASCASMPQPLTRVCLSLPLMCAFVRLDGAVSLRLSQGKSSRGG
jgi:hypothetical protein